MTIAILALQGAFIEHAYTLDRLKVNHFEIRQLCDLNRPFDGLILPGGESTAIGKLLYELKLYEPLKESIQSGLPVFGTCAGLILLAKKVQGGIVHFGTMDISVKRNAYGRQLGSFHTDADFSGLGMVPMTFIRAPYIVSASKDTQILAQVDNHIVAARQKNQLVTAFHPELDKDTKIHEYFLNMIRENTSYLKGKNASQEVGSQ